VTKPRAEPGGAEIAGQLIREEAIGSRTTLGAFNTRSSKGKKGKSPGGHEKILEGRDVCASQVCEQWKGEKRGKTNLDREGEGQPDHELKKSPESSKRKEGGRQGGCQERITNAQS